MAPRTMWCRNRTCRSWWTALPQKGIKITYNKIDGANHFFDKREAEVVETVKEYVSNMMSKPREGR